MGMIDWKFYEMSDDFRDSLAAALRAIKAGRSEDARTYAILTVQAARKLHAHPRGPEEMKRLHSYVIKYRTGNMTRRLQS